MKTLSLLVGISNNVQEYNDALVKSANRPRLPLPYGFGTEFYNQGYRVSAVDFSSSIDVTKPQHPFDKVYRKSEMIKAISAVDYALFWASSGIQATISQLLLLPPRKKVILASYVWSLKTLPIHHLNLGISTRCVSFFTKAIVLMTNEQIQIARQVLPSCIPIIKFTCGVDTAFYQSPITYSDVPEEKRRAVEGLLKSPYVIMLGDQQRCDIDALEILSSNNVNLVRVARRVSRLFKQEVVTRGLSERCFFFEQISYPFLRFLLRNASAYIGLVNSQWQPAGWTVACEALASGLPIVMYEGLVSRELTNLGGDKFISTVPAGDTKVFREKLANMLYDRNTYPSSSEIQKFAMKELNLEITAKSFTKSINSLLTFDI